jgi:2-desacetyl-2-hydroxyethyl bacteriochlorophyllide A dehydrogenase
MKYIVCDHPGNLSLKERESPAVESGDILLKVKAVGICGTDLHAFKGNQPFFSYPRILGHELAAEIIDTGDSTTRLSAGDRVVVIPYLNCKECQACLSGKSNCCEHLKVLGVHTDGGMQELICVPERLLIRANDLSLEEIAIVEPLSIGAHALRRSQIQRNEIMIVIGCGPIGVGLVQLGKYLGANVIAIDTNEYRLKIALEDFGADAVINAQHFPAEKVKEITNGKFAHVVFDATGNKTAMETTVNYIRHGGTIVFVGLTNGPLTFHHPAIHKKEASLLCSRNATKEDFEFVMNVLREKKFNVTSYVSRQANYKRIVTDFNTWSAADSKDIKILTIWDD